jgi:hypothetical protein
MKLQERMAIPYTTRQPPLSLLHFLLKQSQKLRR